MGYKFHDNYNERQILNFDERYHCFIDKPNIGQ